jgi:hypothetical protein
MSLFTGNSGYCTQRTQVDPFKSIVDPVRYNPDICKMNVQNGITCGQGHTAASVIDVESSLQGYNRLVGYCCTDTEQKELESSTKNYAYGKQFTGVTNFVGQKGDFLTWNSTREKKPCNTLSAVNVSDTNVFFTLVNDVQQPQKSIFPESIRGGQVSQITSKDKWTKSLYTHKCY